MRDGKRRPTKPKVTWKLYEDQGEESSKPDRDDDGSARAYPVGSRRWCDWERAPDANSGWKIDAPQSSWNKSVDYVIAPPLIKMVFLFTVE
ncbi:hypothetical protein NL676_031111 [Syzygium grande]|nr:hypothetical protein NL676_031111 [Syzygium grande]